MKADAAEAGVEVDDFRWAVPYLPIDPKDIGRNYEAVIRVNSQSGKGGVAYIMETEHGMVLPRRLQIEFSGAVQHATEDTGTEISPAEMWRVFSQEYLPAHPPIELVAHETAAAGDRATVVAHVRVRGDDVTLT